MGTRKITELTIDIILLLSGIGLFMSSLTIEPGSTIGQGGDFVPKLCTGLWIFVSICLIITEMMARDDHEKGISANIKGFFATLVLLVVYVFALDKLGFVLSSAIYMFIQMCIFVPSELRSKKNYILFVILSIVVPLAVNELFVEVFSLILPEGII
jgi:hypothetical protein